MDVCAPGTEIDLTPEGGRRLTLGGEDILGAERGVVLAEKGERRLQNSMCATLFKMPYCARWWWQRTYPCMKDVWRDGQTYYFRYLLSFWRERTICQEYSMIVIENLRE